MASVIARGVVLDEYRQVGRFNPRVEVSISLDETKPRLNVTASTAFRSVRESAENSTTDDSNDVHDTLHEEGSRKKIEFALGKGADFLFGIPTSNHAGESESTFIKFLNDLPQSTKSAIQAMKLPVIITFNNTQSGMLTQETSTRIPLRADRLYEEIVRKAQSRTYLLLHCSDTFVQDLRVLQGKFHTVIEPLKQCFSETLSAVKFDDKHFDPIRMKPSKPIYEARVAFPKLEDYMSIQLTALILDQGKEIEERRAWEASSPNLILISRESPSNSKSTLHYLGLIQKPSGKSFTLQPATTLEIRLPNPNSSTWRAEVTDDRIFTKKGMISVFVTRGKVQGSNLHDKTIPNSVIYDAGKELKHVKWQVRQASGIKVRVKVTNSDTEDVSVRRAYQTLGATPARREKGAAVQSWRARIMYLLRGLELNILPELDLYALTGLQVDPRTFMNDLNYDQCRIVAESRNLTGGLQVVQGPPGTGKTYLISQMVAPFLASKKNILVLVGAPTNHGADDLARILRKTRQRLIDNHGLIHLKARPVLRIISKVVELDIVRSYNPPQSSKSVAPRAAGVQRKEGLDGCFQERMALTNPKLAGIQDKRVQDPEISVGYTMLVISGLIPGTPHGQNTGKYQKFRDLHVKQKTEVLSADELQHWDLICDTLFRDALSRASAVVGTTAGISASYTLPHIKDRVAAVFLDENAFQTEVGMAPLLAADFSLDPCLVVVGDQDQLSPVAKAGHIENPFRSQLRFSFMARMIDAGMGYTMLREQYRMVPDIVSIPNTLTYHEQLTTNASAQVANRPIAQQFRRFAHKWVGKETSKMMIDIPPSHRNETTGLSKRNDFSVSVVTDLAEKLLAEFKDTAEIAILTPYRAQVEKFKNIKGMMQTLKLPHNEKLTVNTFTESQGRQYDIVIVEIIVDTHLGIIRDKKMTNVAISRAKSAVILVCNEIALRAAIEKPTKAPGDPQHLRDLLGMFKDVTYIRPKQDELPPNKYYKPDLSHKALFDHSWTYLWRVFSEYSVDITESQFEKALEA